MRDAEVRIQSLERRLEALEAELAARRGGEPLPAPPAEPDADSKPWLRRLHAAVLDLASDQRDLHGQLGAIVAHLEDLFQGEQPAAGGATAIRRSAFTPVSANDSAARRLARRIIAAARRGRSLAGRFWRSSAPVDWIHRQPVREKPPALSLAVLSDDTVDPAWQRLAVESIECRDGRCRIRRLGPDGKGLDEKGAQEQAAPEPAAVPATELAEASRADVLLFVRGPAGSGLARAATDLMAVEDLPFLHLRLPPNGELLFVRRQWWHAGGVCPERLGRAPRSQVLGKSIGLGGSPRPPLPAPAAERIRRFKGRWLAAAGPKKPIHHRRRFGDPDEGDAVELAVVLTRPVGGGLDRLLAGLFEPTGGPALLVQLGDEGLAPAHPVAGAVYAQAAGVLCHPLGDLYDPQDRPLALCQLLARHRPRRLLHIGPGTGLFDTGLAELDERLDAVAKLEHFAVADPRFPGRQAAPPATAGLFTPTAFAGEPRAPLPEAEAARRRLGLPPGAVVAAHLGDLGFDERPEDLLAALAALPDDRRPFLLLAGRGPLAASLDDLARFHGLETVLRRQAPAEEALAACDIVVSAAERLPLPWPLTAALAHGRPLITAAADDGLEPALRRAVDEASLRVPAGDVTALAQAIAGLSSDESERRRLGERAMESRRRLEEAATAASEA